MYANFHCSSVLFHVNSNSITNASMCSKQTLISHSLYERIEYGWRNWNVGENQYVEQRMYGIYSNLIWFGRAELVISELFVRFVIHYTWSNRICKIYSFVYVDE